MNINEKLKKEKNAIYGGKIVYNGKDYIKVIKYSDNGIEYLYYEIENDEIKEIEDKDAILYLKNNCEISEGNIVY